MSKSAQREIFNLLLIRGRLKDGITDKVLESYFGGSNIVFLVADRLILKKSAHMHKPGDMVVSNLLSLIRRG